MRRAESHDAIVASVVFPLADLRPVLLPEAGAITAPFRLRDSRVHVRRFGSAAYRQQNPRAAAHPALAAAESWYVSAHRFLRVPGAPVAPRLFADGLLCARVEATMLPPDPATHETLDAWVKRLLAQPVELRASRPGKRSPERRAGRLGDVARAFRVAYLAATTCEPIRRESRTPDSEAGQILSRAQRHVCPLEPLVMLQMPPRLSTAPGLALHTGVVRIGGGAFRLLALYPDAAQDAALLRLARRAFTRLHAEGRAILALLQSWPDHATIRPEAAVVDALDRMASRLGDASAALRDDRDLPVPLLGEIAPLLADAAVQLAARLSQSFPDSGRELRRLAARIGQARGPTNVYINDHSIVGVQGSLQGGSFVQTVARAP